MENIEDNIIPKDGDPTCPTNWRPIALCPTIAKVYSALITKRLSNWIEENNILSPAQKGFRPADGCFEHCFIVEERFRRARVTREPLSALSVDLADAFCSVGHSAISAALHGSGAGEIFTDIITDMYNGAFTQLLTEEGISELVPITRGVKQGESASGVIFDLVIDPALRIAQENLNEELEYTILALADDVFIVHKDINKLQEIANQFCQISTSIGLRVNPRKCFSIHMPGGRVRTEPTPVYVCGTPVKALPSDECAPFLGKPIGLFQDKTDISEVSQTAHTILDSNLTPWQKIDAMKTFLYPSLNYKMRTGQILKTIWNNLDHDLCAKYSTSLTVHQ